MAGVFSVMACAVRAMDDKDVDETFMTSLAKVATSEMITSKVGLILCSIQCIFFSFQVALCKSTSFSHCMLLPSNNKNMYWFALMS